MARYRKTYLEERIVRARLAALAMETMPEQASDQHLGQILLKNSESYAIIVRQPDRRLLISGKSSPPPVDATYDLMTNTFFGWIRDAFETLFQQENRVLRVIGDDPKTPGVRVEVLIDETPMRLEMYGFSRRIFDLSIVISLFTATLVYLSLQWLMVRPMRRVTRNMERFRLAPEDETRILVPSDRSDEIGIAQRELTVMQRELRLALRQKDRLAMLGAAMTKVNHDLRNSLATAMLVGDRLAASGDPEVQRLVPRMFKPMDRAVSLCSQTLDYSSATTPDLALLPLSLFDMADAAGETLVIEARAEGNDSFRWQNEVPGDLKVMGDAGQLLRVFENLGRNARQAGANLVRIMAKIEDDIVVVDMTDDGPGMADKALEHMFQPFAGSTRDGGTGLGLVIAREIIRAHGGEIELAGTGPEGTWFRLRLPEI